MFLLLFSLLVPSILGCAPVAPGDNSTSTSASKGTFSFAASPPTTWTFGSTPPQIQGGASSDEAVQSYVQQQIEQAAKTLFVNKGISVSNLTVTLDPHDLKLNNVTLEASCTAIGNFIETTTNPPYVSKECESDTASVPFTPTFSGKFDTGGLVLSNDMWSGIAVSMQNILSADPYGAHFSTPLVITPTP